MGRVGELFVSESAVKKSVLLLQIGSRGMPMSSHSVVGAVRGRGEKRWGGSVGCTTCWTC